MQVEYCETLWSHLLKTARRVEIAGVEVQTIKKMLQEFLFQISVGLNCLVSPMPKDIVVLLLFIDRPY